MKLKSYPFSSSILRKLNYFFFFTLKLYLAGMVFFRFSRKIRNRINKDKKVSNFIVTDNCLGNLKMNLDIHSYMGGCIYWSGLHHVNESIYLSRILKDEFVFIDIGANQGEFTLFASKFINSGRILSFEPVQENFNRLSQNLKLNSIQNCEPYKFGLSNANDFLPIFTDESASEGGGINEGLSTLFKSETKGSFQEEIELKVFDEFFNDEFTRIDFIKIDIEGSELYALKGMKETLLKYKPEILIEINEDCFLAAGYNSKDILSFLFELNYKPFKLFRGKLISHEGDFTNWGNYIFK